MLSFVGQGNTAFISTDYLPYFLNDFQFTKETTYQDDQNQDVFIDQFPTAESSVLKVKPEDSKTHLTSQTLTIIR